MQNFFPFAQDAANAGTFAHGNISRSSPSPKALFMSARLGSRPTARAAGGASRPALQALCACGRTRPRHLSFGIPGEVLGEPGAVPEDEFLSLCIRYDKCRKVCPYGLVSPVLISENQSWHPQNPGILGSELPTVHPGLPNRRSASSDELLVIVQIDMGNSCDKDKDNSNRDSIVSESSGRFWYCG